MTAFGDDAKPHSHLLDAIGDRSEDHEKPDQVIFVFGSCDRVSGDAASVVVGKHHDQSGSREDDIETYRLPEALDLIVELGDPVHMLSSRPSSSRIAVRSGKTGRGPSDRSQVQRIVDGNAARSRKPLPAPTPRPWYALDDRTGCGDRH